MHGSDCPQPTAIFHRIDRIQHQIAQRTAQLAGVGFYDQGLRGRAWNSTLIGCAAMAGGWLELHRRLDNLVEIHTRTGGAGIFAKSLKRPMMVLRLRTSSSSVEERALAKDFIELLRRGGSGALQILHRNLQGKQRIFQLMRQPPRQFPPGGDAFGLRAAVALFHKLLRSCD